jgi:uncharacterized protein YecE (DUF72 family)
VTGGELRIGISGWRYEPWRGVFYPEGLPQRRELEHAARHFNSIEINGSFYSLQKPGLYQRWYEATPEGFVFAVKGGRFITHMKKLVDVRTALANFFASGVLCLEEKLGPILWQFPAALPCDARFEPFFRMLPRDTREAAALAGEHAEWMTGRVVTETRARRPLRYAVEVRAASCVEPSFIELLRAHDIACVVADTAGRWPCIEDVTSSFMYLRLHGDKRLYESGYGPRAIARWAERIAAWRAGGEPADAQRVLDRAPPSRAARDVYVYFDNDVKVHAPFDAAALARALDADIGAPLKNKRARMAKRKPLRQPIFGQDGTVNDRWRARAPRKASRG